MATDLFMERYEAARHKRIASTYGTKIPEFTVGDLYDAVFSVDNDEDARQFFAGYVAWLAARDDLNDDPKKIARSNIGWMFGEGMAQDRIAMWVRCTDSAHPILGTMVGQLSPEELIETGRRFGAGE